MYKILLPCVYLMMVMSLELGWGIIVMSQWDDLGAHLVINYLTFISHLLHVILQVFYERGAIC